MLKMIYLKSIWKYKQSQNKSLLTLRQTGNSFLFKMGRFSKQKDYLKLYYIHFLDKNQAKEMFRKDLWEYTNKSETNNSLAC